MAGDNSVRCPHCRKSLGDRTREGDARVRLAITLVKSDGTVHGPCPHCRGDVVVAQGGAPSPAVGKALTPAARRTSARLVFDFR